MPAATGRNRPAWPNISLMRSALGRGKRVEMLQPDVAIVDFAQERLHPLGRLHRLVEPPRVHGPADLQRVSQPLGGDPHGVVALAVVRIGQAVLMLEQLVQLPQDVPAGAGKGPGVRTSSGGGLHLPEDSLARPLHFPQNARPPSDASPP